MTLIISNPLVGTWVAEFRCMCSKVEHICHPNKWSLLFLWEVMMPLSHVFVGSQSPCYNFSTLSNGIIMHGRRRSAHCADPIMVSVLSYMNDLHLTKLPTIGFLFWVLLAVMRLNFIKKKKKKVCFQLWLIQCALSKFVSILFEHGESMQLKRKKERTKEELL